MMAATEAAYLLLQSQCAGWGLGWGEREIMGEGG